MKIRKPFITMFTMIALVCLSACGVSRQTNMADESTAAPETEKQIEASGTMIYAHIGDHVLEIQPESNSSTDAFIEQLDKGDIVVELHDYGSFEKVGPLGMDFPANDERITTEPGDLILYQGNQITIYYDTNTWSFTRLGKVQGLSQAELKAILGDGDVTVTFSLNRETQKGQGIGKLDFDTHTVLLNSGYEMPILGVTGIMSGTEDIAANDYDLSINKYKEVEYVPVEYPPTSEILANIKNIEAEIQTELNTLEKLLSQ